MSAGITRSRRRGGWALLLAAGMGLCIAAAPASAQTQPNPQPGNDMPPAPDQINHMDRAMNHYQPGGPGYMPGPGGYGDRFDDMRNGGNSPFSTADFPTREMAAAVNANAHAAMARHAFNVADEALNSAINRAQESFEHSEQYTRALDDEKKAYAEYESARSAAIGKIANDPQYRAASDLRDSLREKIAERRGTRGVKTNELVALALVKLSYATTATAMEAVATADDSHVRDAQNRLLSAGAHVRDLRRSFEDSVRNDPGFITLRKNLEEARGARLYTAAILEGSIEISNQALDYVYWRHWTDHNNYGSYYDNYNYPYYGNYGYPVVRVVR